METLPVILSIPHNGTSIPEIIQPAVALSADEILRNTDLYTRDIYAGNRKKVLAVVETDINRLFVDVNRPSSLSVPAPYPKAVTYLDTTDGTAIYHRGCEPTPDRVRQLMEAHYYPYHEKLKAAIHHFPQAKFGLDCHSMRGIGSKTSRGNDAGAKRPAICLSDAEGLSCPPDMIKCLGHCLSASFELDPEEVCINRPFKGGFITRHYGQNSRLPWIQIELNRDLYLDADTLQPKPGVILEFNEKFIEALALFCHLQDLTPEVEALQKIA